MSLWEHIHAKRKRIAEGSGEKMRKKGAKGAPTEAAMKKAQGMNKGGMPMHKMPDGTMMKGAQHYAHGGMAKKGYSKGGMAKRGYKSGGFCTGPAKGHKK